MLRSNPSFLSRLSVSLAAAGAALLALAGPAGADVFTVTNLNDGGDGSLRNAILDANVHSGSDVIQFASGLTGQISLTSGQLVINGDVTIEGPGANLLAVDAGQTSRVLRVEGGASTIRGLTLSNGRCAVGDTGGGIDLRQGSLILEDCAISRNAVPLLSGAGRDGGGVLVNGWTTFMARRCLFAANTVGAGAGGAINAYPYAIVSLETCTIIGNQAEAGGGIFAEPYAQLTMESCTVTANTADNAGGVDAYDFSVVTLHNCLIAGNAAAKNPDAKGWITSLGYNLIGDTGSSFGWLATDLLNVNPMVDGLADNGGPTMTCALQPLSPARDAADPNSFPSVDQRGNFRPQRNRADIGAFELNNGAPVLTVPSSLSVVVGSLLTFRATATDPDGDSLTFDLTSATNAAGATIDPVTGVVSWTPTAPGTYDIFVRVSDSFGGYDKRVTTVNVSAIGVPTVTLTRDAKGTVTVKFPIRNGTSTTANDVTVTAGTLGGVNTNTPLPQYMFTIKPGTSKQGTLQFKGVPSGPAMLVIQGTSSLGSFSFSQIVNVP